MGGWCRAVVVFCFIIYIIDMTLYFFIHFTPHSSLYFVAPLFGALLHSRRIKPLSIVLITCCITHNTLVIIPFWPPINRYYYYYCGCCVGDRKQHILRALLYLFRRTIFLLLTTRRSFSGSRVRSTASHVLRSFLSGKTIALLCIFDASIII